jgi:hypothetical protein
MKSRSATTAAALACVGLLCSTLPAPAARGGLGERAASVQADLARIRGQIRRRIAPGYRVDEITTPAGTVVKEFISPAGVVFAVSWRGPVMPDLAQIMGSGYFTMLKAAETRERASLGHNHVQLRTPQLIVHAGGHMRFFFGVAYVPSLVPPDVSISNLH